MKRYFPAIFILLSAIYFGILEDINLKYLSLSMFSIGTLFSVVIFIQDLIEHTLDKKIEEEKSKEEEGH